MTVAVTESLTIGLFEHRSPLTGPEATAEALVRRHRYVVVDLGDAPAGLRVLDRYSGEYLPEGTDHPESAPIKQFMYVPDGSQTSGA